MRPKFSPGDLIINAHEMEIVRVVEIHGQNYRIRDFKGKQYEDFIDIIDAVFELLTEEKRAELL